MSGESLSETYLQISPNILESFPKFRPPVDLYVFDMDTAQTKKYHKAEERLSKDRQAEVAGFAAESLLFLLREDYRIYASHLSKKLGLILTEDDFTPQEVAQIFFIAFRDRVEDFFGNPTEGPFKAMAKDVSILAEYVWADPGRVEYLTATIHKEYSLTTHSVNTMFVGLALFTLVTAGKFRQADLVDVALGLLLHDVGMIQVPRFVLDRAGYLVQRDRTSIENHVEAGESMMMRLRIQSQIILDCMRQHHERLDGSGYPNRRFKKDISLIGKVCAVADSFCAMVCERPFREPKDIPKAVVTLAKDTAKYEPVLTKLLAVLMIQGGKLRTEMTVVE
ncbi:HD family phosphohydrolase [Pseudodesulfovibrio portus]|uniref:HD family phosphohydrolase n=2 Tax=Pseudodesulfovibrio portus TaxID=231439 RepID=A0ABN6RVL0_9BACT|nr:HD family phosphohydrolase [Pseudodesulfovibrio portus]